MSPDVFAQCPYFIIIIWVGVIAAVAAVVERLVTRWLRKFIERTPKIADAAGGWK